MKFPLEKVVADEPFKSYAVECNHREENEGKVFYKHPKDDIGRLPVMIMWPLKGPGLVTYIDEDVADYLTAPQCRCQEKSSIGTTVGDTSSIGTTVGDTYKPEAVSWPALGPDYENPSIVPEPEPSMYVIKSVEQVRCEMLVESMAQLNRALEALNNNDKVSIKGLVDKLVELAEAHKLIAEDI